MGLPYWIMNIGLLVIGFLSLGRAFGIKTIYVIVLTSVLFNVLPLFPELECHDFANDKLLGALLGAALESVGLGLVLLRGGSSGGTDIIAFIICKLFPRLKSSTSIFIVDATVVLLGVFVIDNIVVSFLGIVSIIVSSVVIDKLFLGGQKTFIAQIITDRHSEISEKILRDLERGATVIDVTGAYSGDAHKMVMVSFTLREYNRILGIIGDTDRSAFVTVHRAHEISGEGFTR